MQMVDVTNHSVSVTLDEPSFWPPEFEFEHTHTQFRPAFFLSIVQCIINSNSIASHVQAFRCLYQMSSLTLWIHAHGIVHRNVTKFEFTPKENDLLWFGNHFLKRFFQISRILNVADFYSPALAAHLLGVVSSHEVVLSI